jgi:hypothetical protein
MSYARPWQAGPCPGGQRCVFGGMEGPPVIPVRLGRPGSGRPLASRRGCGREHRPCYTRQPSCSPAATDPHEPVER